MSNKMTKKESLKSANIKKKDKALICPKCMEMIYQLDVENYSKCPYCDYKFEANNDFEDFILQPIVDQWVQEYKDFR